VTPTVYVGGQLIRGAETDLVYRDAFSRAERGDDRRGLPASIYFSLAGLLAVLVAFLGARGPRERRVPPAT
jgi:hypothetical protein